MSRARAIETRLEKLLPSVEEYFTSGFLTREETQEVARERTHWEYRLVAKPLLVLDVRNAIAYELGLERRLREYCVATGLVLRHRWAILDRIESVYRIGLKHIRDAAPWEQLRRDLVLFLKDHDRHAALSALYGELLAAHPTRGALWAEAIRFEGAERANPDGGRAIAQQGLVAAGAQPDVWAAAFALELHFADRCLRRAAAESKDPVAALRAENGALASIVLDAALARAVAAEALAGPACGLELAQRLLDAAVQFPHTAAVADAVAAEAMAAALARPWPAVPLAAFARDFVRLDATLAEKGVRGDAAEVLRGAPAPNLAQARALSIAGAMAALRENGPAAVSLRGAIAAAVVALIHEMAAARVHVAELCAALLARGLCAPEEALRLLRVAESAEAATEMTQVPCDRVRRAFAADIANDSARSAKRARHGGSETDGAEALRALWRAEGLGTFVGGANSGAGDDVEALLTALRSGADANETIQTFCRARGLLPMAQWRCGPEAPAALWRVFACLAERGADPPRSLRGSDSDDESDSDDDEAEADAKGYAALGMRFLATAPRAESAWRDGVSALLALRVCRAAGLRAPDRTGAALRDRLRPALRAGAAARRQLRACVLSACRGAALPRAAVVAAALPALEALALEDGGAAESLREARALHESLVALRGADGAAESAEESAADWAALVAFERDIAKDLKRAKEATARARREAVDPQRILAMLNAQI